MLRELLAEAPLILAATSELAAVLGDAAAARVERAELRGHLASRTGIPRVAALLWSESADEQSAAGDGDGALAAYRRALALDPQDRIVQDRVEQALRAAGRRAELAEHLAFRSSSADAQTRAALALEQAQISMSSAAWTTPPRRTGGRWRATRARCSPSRAHGASPRPGEIARR